MAKSDAINVTSQHILQSSNVLFPSPLISTEAWSECALELGPGPGLDLRRFGFDDRLLVG